jgi:hypothetical protein
MKKLIPLTIVLFALAGGVVSADSKDNDRVLKGTQFIEVFKDDGDGKNYLYTITEFKDKWSRNCTVVTGDSEKTIALDCETPRG